MSIGIIHVSDLLFDCVICCWVSWGSGGGDAGEICFVFVLFNRVSLCRPGWPGTSSVREDDLELKISHASSSQVLRLQHVPPYPAE